MITVTVQERKQIDDIIQQNKVCYIGLIDKEGFPYVIPMNFGYSDDIVYLHSAQEGGAIEALKENPNVCVTFCTEPLLVHQNEEVACSYRMKGSSVICRGKVSFENDYDEKVKALDVIMKQYTDRTFVYSEPAVRNVLIWKIPIDKVSTKIFGVPHPNSKRHQ